MGFLKKLLICSTIGIMLSPYYIYSSNRNMGYGMFNKRPALVQSIRQNKPKKQKKEDLEFNIEQGTDSKSDLEFNIEKDSELFRRDETYTSPVKPIIKAQKKYTIIEDKDFFLFRGIGYIGSLPIKAFLMSWNMNNYVKPDTKKSIETLLENDPDIDGLTVRLNHTRPFGDVWRLFTEKQLRERNNILARIFFGMPTTLLGEFFAKFTRSDYYNPYTKVAVLYSNVEAVAKHEIGHHRDFTRFNRDWIYSLSRILPPVMLYQEWKASKYAKWTLEEQNRYQFGRYLTPAYATYLFATTLSMIKLLIWLKKRKKKKIRRC